MQETLQNAGLFFINTCFDFYLMLLMIRFILCWAGADYFNPITRFIIRITQALVSPVRRILRTYRKVEWATLFIIVVLEILRFYIVSLLITITLKNPAGLAIMASADTLKLFFNTLFYAVLLSAVFSLIQQSHSPLGRILSLLSTPILQPIQRLLPPIGGLDFSPIPALFLLRLLSMSLAEPLMMWGSRLAFGTLI